MLLRCQLDLATDEGYLMLVRLKIEPKVKGRHSRACLNRRVFRNGISFRNNPLSLLNHLPNNSQIIQRFMNSSRHKPDTLSNLPIRILLRRTTKILLHTLQVPLKLLHGKQSCFCLLVLSQLKRFAQSTGLSQSALGEQR